MQTKGFTLVELLISITAIVAGGLIAWTVIKGGSYMDNSTMMDYYHPNISRAISNREMVEEMRRANDLKEQELRQRKAEQ